MALKIDSGRKDGRSYKQGKYKYSRFTIDVGVKANRNPNINLSASKKNIGQMYTQNQLSSVSQQPVTQKIKKKISLQTRGAIEIKRGQKVSLTQKISNLSRLLVALEWDIKNEGTYPMELDASIFMVDINNKTAEEDFIFYNNLSSRCGGVKLKADHGTGLLEGFDEMVQLDLDKIPPHIQKLAFTVTIDQADERRQNFSLVSNGYFRIIDGQRKMEILNYRFNEQLSIETAIVIAEIYRYKNEWKINAIGSGFKGGLQALCENYGIETE